MKLISLIYHDIEAEEARGRYAVSLRRFREHLAAIKEAVGGAPTITGDAAEMTGFALTFDDGHKGWLAAADALEELRWKAFFFVVTGLIGGPGKLVRSDIRRLAAMGHVIGSHTVDHTERISKRDPAFILDQWSRSRAALEDILGREVTSAAVPGGYYSAKVGRAADAAGLRHLFTSEPVATSWDVGGCRILGRYLVTNGMDGRAVASLAAGERAGRMRQYVAWNLKKAVKAFTLDPYRAFRERH